MHLQGRVNYYGDCFELFENNGIEVLNSTAFTDIINATTAPVPAARYKVTVSYAWNGNITNQDFVSQLEVNGADVRALSDEIHRQEAKDAFGTGVAGTGTNQIYGFTREYVVTIPTAQTVNMVLRAASSANGSVVSIFNASLEFKRVEL